VPKQVKNTVYSKHFSRKELPNGDNGMQASILSAAETEHIQNSIND